MKWMVPALLVVVLLACAENRVYEDFTNLDGVWHQDSVLSFPFKLEDSAVSYNIQVSLTNRHTFPFHNFYFNYALVDGNDSIVQQGLQEMILFDPKTGSPRGSGSGNLFDQEIYIVTDYQFPHGGDYRVNLTQFMRLEEMTDIERVGVRVEFSVPE